MSIDFDKLRALLAPHGLDVRDLVINSHKDGTQTVRIVANVIDRVRRHPIVGEVRSKPEFATDTGEQSRQVAARLEWLRYADGPTIVCRSQDDLESRVGPDEIRFAEETSFGKGPPEPIVPLTPDQAQRIVDVLNRKGSDVAAEVKAIVEKPKCHCKAPWNTGHEPGCEWKAAQS